MKNSVLFKWIVSTEHARLITANVVVFLIIQTVLIVRNLGGFAGPFAHEDLWLAATTNGAMLLLRPWTLITHMFTHIAFSHFLWNMVWLYFSGRMFEGLYNQSKMRALYLAGGLFGFGVLFMITAVSALPQAITLGASAAVMAVFIAVAVSTPDAEVHVFGIIKVKLKYLAIVYVLLDYMALRGEVNVGGHIAHLGGAVFGFLFAWQIRKGINILKPVEALLKFKISTGRNKSGSVTNVKKMSDEEYNVRRKVDGQRLDAILDKIARSGYDNLTKDEKDFLFRQSSKTK